MSDEKLIGRPPVMHNQFCVWMARKQLSVRMLAGILGVSPGTVNRLRQGGPMHGPVKRLLLVYYPDCPVGKKATMLSPEPLPVPVVTGPRRPRMVSPLARLSRSLNNLTSTRKKARG